MDQAEIKYWVGLSGWKGLGWKKLELLIKHFGSIKRIWLAGPKLNPKWQNKLGLDKEMEELGKRLIKVITIEDKRYPKILKEIDSPPFILYVKGKVEELNRPGLAVVGTRKPTEYGRKAVRQLVPEIAKKLVIVSGLARGIDSLSHWQCLQTKGKTVAVLGHGLEQIYPSENIRLAQEIVHQGGCLVTEYPLNYPMDKVNFPQRNRIIAGLTLGTLVIEGGQRSGTKITANMAADYGREVFCVPGPINSELSLAPAELIQNGAKLVTKAEDIWDELNLNK
ncbi:MAG: DNA-processing protein DprA [Patescibacteria group bacterium]|nr:DNA-processing protein DprA [Patescibacteria group bacterium]